MNHFPEFPSLSFSTTSRLAETGDGEKGQSRGDRREHDNDKKIKQEEKGESGR